MELVMIVIIKSQILKKLYKIAVKVQAKLLLLHKLLSIY